MVRKRFSEKRNAFLELYIHYNMIKREDILHKTTYVWKENEKYTSIIKNDGSRVILNKKDSDIWKIINDDDTVDDIIRHMKDTMSANQVEDRLEEFIKIGIITNEDMFWGDDLL